MDCSTQNVNESIPLSDSRETDTFGWSDFPLIMHSSKNHDPDFHEDGIWGQFHDTNADLSTFWQAPVRKGRLALRNEVLTTIVEEAEEWITPTTRNILSKKTIKSSSIQKYSSNQRGKPQEMPCALESSRERTTSFTKAIKRVGRQVQQRHGSLDS